MLDAVYRAVRPTLRFLDPEAAHRMAVKALAAGLPLGHAEPDGAILACRIWDLELPNPLGLAAGFDKNAEAPDALLRLGFGHVEVGTVTPRPQPGNPRPRLFRLAEDEAVINRYGFNSDGLDLVVRRAAARQGRGRGGIVGINVGKNKDTADEVADFVTGIRAVAPFADYLVINVSSPNTPGLRDLQARASMERLVQAALAARTEAATGRIPPLLIKLAPDLDDAGLSDVAEVALATEIDGLIMGNTTISRPAALRSAHRGETGGLSGKPLFDLSTRRLSDLYRLTGGHVPLVGAGGVSSGADAYAKIRAGASLVQLYSALVFEGPALVGRIKRDLAALLRRDGFGSVSAAIGADHR
jgi:dihydroorotate dehydrogenase